MHLPIKISDEVYGVFCVGYEAPHAFSPDEQRLFAALSHRTAIAIENARHYDQEHRRAEQFHLISEVGQRMNAVLAPDDLLEQLTALIRDAFDCSNVAIGFVEGNEVVAQVECGTGKVYEGLRAPVGEDGLWGWVAQNREPLLVNDARGEGGFPRAAGAARDFPSQICVPLTSKDETIGILSIAGDQPNQFDEEDLMVLEALASQAATAIENARLYEQGQQMAVSEERSRLARELHDAVTQTLFSASLIAEALPAIWEADREEGEELLEQMRKLSRGALAEMRTLLLELRPAALADAALPDLMRQLADGASGRIGAPVEVIVEDTCDLPQQVRVTLYRIAQEALNNVAKHARASRVSLKLTCPAASHNSQDTAVMLEVCDDGCGFDPESVSPEHLGLGIIRERADAIGAESQIISEPGRGTVVRVHWREEPAGQPE
jgi:two-component system nitrate/nitrite sensor histidine kinase NarX